MTVLASLPGSPLYAFVLLYRRSLAGNALPEGPVAGLEGAVHEVVCGHDAFLVVSAGASLADAALSAEAVLQDALGGESWFLLCPSCSEPLSLAPTGYVCRRHGSVLVFEGRVTPVLPPQRSRRPSRHGAKSRSATKRPALGASWARFVDAPEYRSLPVLVRRPDGSVEHLTDGGVDLPGTNHLVGALSRILTSAAPPASVEA